MTGRPLSRRHTLQTAAGAVTAAPTVAAAPPAWASAAGPGTEPGRTGKPTVLLVHGAFADASSWNPVTERLQQYGHRVVAVANPLRGLPHDSAHVAARLAAVRGPVVLVGHSYGGAVITQAAATAPNVKALVYVSAFIPDAGEVLGELAARFPGSRLEASLDHEPVPGPDGTPGVDLYIRPDRYREVFAQDVPRPTTQVLAALPAPAQRVGVHRPDEQRGVAHRAVVDPHLQPGPGHRPRAPAVPGRPGPVPGGRGAVLPPADVQQARRRRRADSGGRPHRHRLMPRHL